MSQTFTADTLITPKPCSTVCRAPDVAPQLSGLFCYGCPIVGDPAFNAALAARLPHRVYNFVHASDIVTRLPANPEYGPLPGERLIKSFGRFVPLAVIKDAACWVALRWCPARTAHDHTIGRWD